MGMYVIIVGCGRVGAQLAQLLNEEGHSVAVIDKDPKSFLKLGEGFPGETVVGNGFDLDLLRSASIETAGAFCALTDGDNSNLVSAQVAKNIFNVPRVIARVYDPRRANIYKALGLDIISGTILFAALIRDKIVERHFSSYLTQSKEVAVMEFALGEEWVGKKVSEANIAGKFLVTTINRRKEVLIPGLDSTFPKGDIVLGIAKTESVAAIRSKFALK